MKYHSRLALLVLFCCQLNPSECTQESENQEEETGGDTTCDTVLCEQCKDAYTQSMCQKLESCRSSADTDPVCLRIYEAREEMSNFCEKCERTRNECQSPDKCAPTRNQMFPFFPMQCGKAGGKCDKNKRCCRGLSCKKPTSGESKCCIPEKQPCSKIGDQSCCEPYSCEKHPSKKGFLCSVTLPITTTTPKTSTTTTTTTTAIPITTITSPLPEDNASTDCVDEPEVTTQIPTSNPQVQEPNENTANCNSSGVFDPNIYSPPPPDCKSCSINDPTCCDGQYCDTEESQCKSCSAKLNDECKSNPQSGADCCVSALACQISNGADQTGICKDTCKDSFRNVCNSEFNCCRQDDKSSPTRFECKYVNSTVGETYICSKCAKPGECCREPNDCCTYPYGYGCFNNICQFSREED